VTNWQGHLALIAPRERGRVVAFDGLIHRVPPKGEMVATALVTVAYCASTVLRTAAGKTDNLTAHAMTSIDICRMMKRRLKAGLPDEFSPHSFRVTTVTDLLEQNTALEDVQYLAGHADPKTTRLYDRRRRRVTRNIVERISIYFGQEWNAISTDALWQGMMHWRIHGPKGCKAVSQVLHGVNRD